MALNKVVSAIVLSLLFTQVVEARDRVLIVGSSTVFPFATAVAEEFGKSGKIKTPVVESTGSGGGIKLFCAGSGPSYPDVTNASRAMKENELATCKANGVTPLEFTIGYDGIVLANSKDGPTFRLTREQIFQALAGDVVTDGAIRPNPHKDWSDIAENLPDERIVVFGPPPSSGTRDAFEELVMEIGCDSTARISPDKCSHIREDGAYVEAGENDNLIVGKLDANPSAVGIFGYSFLDQNISHIQGAEIEGVKPEFEHIASGSYPISRPLFFYVKREHLGKIPGLEGYLAEFLSDWAMGDQGYLASRGLIPLPAELLKQMQDRFETVLSENR